MQTQVRHPARYNAQFYDTTPDITEQMLILATIFGGQLILGCLDWKPDIPVPSPISSRNGKTETA